MTHYTLPPRIDAAGLLVGYSLEDMHVRQPVGFSFGSPDYSPTTGHLDPYLFHGEGHLMTIAPTGAGKGVSCVVPAALRHGGDLVVMDPKGENYAVTARRRREMGQKVHLIDPFGVTKDWPDRVEPDASGIDVFALMPFLSEDPETAAQSLAGMLAARTHGEDRDFWDIAAQNILSGLIDCYRALGQGFDRLMLELRARPATPNRTLQADYFPDAISAPDDVRVFMQASGLDFRALLDPFMAALQELHDSKAPVIEEESPLEDPVDWGFDDAPGLRGQDSDAALLERYEEGLKEGRLEEEFLLRFMMTMGQSNAGAKPSMEVLAQARDWILEVLPSTIDAPKRATDQLPVVFDEEQEIQYPIAILKVLAARSRLAQAVAAQITAAPNRTWGSMLATLESNISYMQARGVCRMLSAPGFDIDRFRAGTGTSVYIVFPPHKLASHAPLLSMLFKGLINVICDRKVRPERNTLMLMDEVAQLGYMEEFVAAKTLLRGYGVMVWSFWQDLSQLRSRYPDNWETLINNCKVFQAFGCATPLQAGALDRLFDMPRSSLMDLEDNEMLLAIYGDDPVIARKPRYFMDPGFRGLFDRNPLQGAPDHDTCEESIEVPSTRSLRPASRPPAAADGS
ncbi:type IV secretory system conjugative DNA transfer family protein [Salipiger bermudensis]|uniref:type IV secretory system conjugative DNA transfer family protein n=1 Tax=Salipiger bermudensis TaxID=344736 RepID=UPI001CD458F8|nr:type IV secretory system conjugative DNA transfer family protein [Salipiger bermudensis]MCA1288115.1 type IV secretory system conjugative DNA transfer family protein [Salipiger bermudensis]